MEYLMKHCLSIVKFHILILVVLFSLLLSSCKSLQTEIITVKESYYVSGFSVWASSDDYYKKFSDLESFQNARGIDFQFTKSPRQFNEELFSENDLIITSQLFSHGMSESLYRLIGVSIVEEGIKVSVQVIDSGGPYTWNMTNCCYFIVVEKLPDLPVFVDIIND